MENPARITAGVQILARTQNGVSKMENPGRILNGFHNGDGKLENVDWILAAGPECARQKGKPGPGFQAESGMESQKRKPGPDSSQDPE